MNAVPWIAGILGIIVALVGFVGRFSGAQVIRGHAPATFLIVGILFLVIGIWLAVLGLQAKK